MGGTGRISVPEVEFNSVWTGQDLEKVLAQLISAQTQALEFDRKEIESAKQNAQGRWCQEGNIQQWGYGEGATAGVFRELETRIVHDLEKLAGTTLIKKYSTTSDLPGLGDGEGMIQQWMDTGDAVIPNMHGAYTKWGTVVSGVEQMSNDARNLMTNSWQSVAGDAYRVNAQERISEADSLRSLANNSRDSVHSMSFMQAATAQAVGGYLTEAVTRCKGVNMTSHANFGGMSPEELKAYDQFYSASRKVNTAVAMAASQIASVDSSSQEWRKEAANVATGLDQAARNVLGQSPV